MTLTPSSSPTPIQTTSAAIWTKSGQPAFPNARWVMGRTEWDFWSGEPDLSALRDDHFIPMMLASAGANLPPIEPLLDFVEPGDEIVPGIVAVDASGHTPGQMALSISSGGEQLLALADAVIHPLHIEQPDWVAPLDLLVKRPWSHAGGCWGRRRSRRCWSSHLIFSFRVWATSFLTGMAGVGRRLLDWHLLRDHGYRESASLVRTPTCDPTRAAGKPLVKTRAHVGVRTEQYERRNQ